MMLKQESIFWQRETPQAMMAAGGLGTPGAIRTHDLQSRSLTLYPTELRAHMALASTGNDSTKRNGCQGFQDFETGPQHLRISEREYEGRYRDQGKPNSAFSGD